MHSKFALQENRLRLLRQLKKHGYFVRMHAYEYIVGDGEKFIAIILLEPYFNRAAILWLSRQNTRDKNKVLEIRRKIDENIKIETRQVPGVGFEPTPSGL